MARLSDHPSQGGRVVDWTPSAMTLDAMAVAPATGVPPSLMQGAHLALAKSKQREGYTDSSWLCVAWEFAGVFDVDVWTDTFNFWLGRHGGMRNWFTADGDAEDTPILRHELPPDQVRFEPTLLPDEVTAEGMLDHVRELMDIWAVPLGRFGYTCTAVIADDRTIVYVGSDHSYTDGVSCLLSVWELTTIYDALRAGVTPELPVVGSYPDYCIEERKLADSFDIESKGVQDWLYFLLRGGGELPRFPVDLGMTPGVKLPVVPVYQELLGEDLDDAYARTVRDLGGTYAGGLYAACAMAAHEMDAATAYRCLNPVHSRWAPEWMCAMGWFINLVPLHVDIEDGDTFASLVRRVRQEFHDNAAAGGVPTLRVAEILAEHLDFDADSSDRPPIMSYLDGDMIPGHEKWREQNFWGLTGAGDDDDVYVWMMRMPGSTYVTCSCPDSPKAVHAVSSYFGRVAEILQEVARTGGDVAMGPAGILEAPVG
ncbi:MAG: hypothetical protein JST73_05950 [Actinobacteria bacterium]|nr:hypothetical protein [Actinomycetota bacterium]